MSGLFDRTGRSLFYVVTINMAIDSDPDKRAETLRERGLDMDAAGPVWDGTHLTFEDDRHDYGEVRLITLGFLDGRMVVVAWTWRGETRRVISMRKANARERARYGPRIEAGDEDHDDGDG